MRKLLWIALAALALGAGGCVVDDTYASCNTTADCNDRDDECYEVRTGATAGRFCSHTCSSDGQCERNFGFDGACYDVGLTGTFLCYQRCNVDSDCYTSSVCLNVALAPGLEDFICVPDN